MLPSIAAAWLLGLVTGARLGPTGASLLVALSIVVALGLFFHGSELAARSWRVVPAALAFSCGLAATPSNAAPCFVSGVVRGRALVESVRYATEDARVRLRLVDGERAEPPARLPEGLLLDTRLPVSTAPSTGSLVQLDADVRPRTTLRNPSPHPRLLPKGPAACWASLRDPQALPTLDAPVALSRLAGLRTHIRNHLRATLSPNAAAVARALVLGDGGALPYELRKTIAAVGLAHLFAVSGLHVGLVSGLVVSLLRWVLSGWARRFDARRIAASLGAPLAVLHAAFAGGSPSAWRAATTAALAWSLVAFGRRPSPVHVSAGATLFLSAPDPSMALRPAFLLSIVATAAILSAPPVAGDSWRWLRSAATVSARTLIATAPMVWWWFGGVPLIGWLTNLLVLPFASWVVIPLAHVVALSTAIPAWATVPAVMFELGLRGLLFLCNSFDALAFTRRLPPLDVWQGVIVLVVCVILLTAKRWSWRGAALFVGALLWFVAEQALITREQPRGVLRVTFVDVGQGDAALLDLPDGRLLAIDTGQGGRHPAGRELRHLLAARRRSRVDLLILTHGHPDHDGGLPELLDEVRIGEIWVNGQALTEGRDGPAQKALQRALRLGTDLRFAPELCDKTHDLGGAELEVVWPCPRYDPGLGLNDNSLTVRVRYGRHALLFPGDLEQEAERRLVRRGAVEAVDVLKVAHHGSRTSTTKAFVAIAQPRLAIVSSGAGNRYGHPDPRVLARLRAAGAKVLRTDLGGGVVITTDGEQLTVLR